ncbi:hypothetical protein [Cupriavidus consociatus]|uniref:hypothetical protein n=1 Tax=Cupriavidus consociatus TaxID=2821357 RepID=UPI001AE583B2|nr:MULTISPECIES: hypothetical protein [unclassified Cupriavidus]MBP0621200.1 hypothetical protein [Cupriavidus sp. LEh25]MDK2657871.1 hypothetical protein [Cupriavidus sp. LEh21]
MKIKSMMGAPIVIGNAIALQPNELISAFVERIYRGATVTSNKAITDIRKSVVNASVGMVAGLGRILPAFGELCPDPVSVSLGHTHLRLLTPFLGIGEAKLLTENAITGLISTIGEPRKFQSYRASRNAALGACPECIREQEATRGFATWDTPPSVRGYNWCARHAAVVVHQCGACGLAYNYLDFGWTPALRCKCGKFMGRRPPSRPCDFAQGIAYDIEQVLAGKLDGIYGEEVRAVMREGGERLRVFSGSPDERTVELLEENGAREFFEQNYRVVHRYEKLKLVMIGNRFSGLPVVNLIASRLLYGSIDTLLSTILVKRAIANVAKSPMPGFATEYSEGQRSAARLLIAETVVAHPDLPRRFLYENAIAPITGIISMDAEWVNALAMQHHASRKALRQRRTDADLARRIEARAIAYQQNAHAPRITIKLLIKGILNVSSINDYPACRTVVDRYREVEGECDLRRWRLLAREFPQCVDPHMATVLARAQDFSISTIGKYYRRLVQRVERLVGEKYDRT